MKTSSCLLRFFHIITLFLILPISLVISFSAAIVEAQEDNYLWAKSMGGIGEDYGSGISVDASGNVYSVGSFYGTVDFDPGVGTFELTSLGGTDIFISKLDSSGNFLWAKSMGGTAYDQGHGIFIDNLGNVYTTGKFYGTVDFDPGTGVANLTGNSVFISKLDRNGNYVWARGVGGASGDIGRSISVDSSGNIYTTGDFHDTADFDPGAGTFNLISAGGYDIFVSKLDSNGNFVWAKSMGGAMNEYGYDIAVDPSGNVYTTGNFNDTADFDPGAGTFNLTSAGNYDIFVSKLNNSGNFVWARGMGGISGDSGFSVSVDSSGNVYTTGNFIFTVDFNPGAETCYLTSAGSFDIFISKLDSDGNFVWAGSMGGTSGDGGSGIFVDPSGNVYITGSFIGTADLDPGVGTFNLHSAGDADIFINKLDSSGNLVWARSMGGALHDYGKSIFTDSSGHVHTTGSFVGTADFDPGAGVFELISAGDSDIFISKLADSEELADSEKFPWIMIIPSLIKGNSLP